MGLVGIGFLSPLAALGCCELLKNFDDIFVLFINIMGCNLNMLRELGLFEC